MGTGIAAVQTPYWRQGTIALAVAALHFLALVGLLAVRMVDSRLIPLVNRTEMVLVALPHTLEKTSRSPPDRNPGQPTKPVWQDYPWTRQSAPGRNAITILRIPRYVAKGPPPCPRVLRPGTPEWKERCASEAPKTAGPDEDDGYEDFSLVPRDAPAFQRWEAELRKRRSPVQVPCTYVRTDPVTHTKSNMADIGCTMKSLFGR